MYIYHVFYTMSMHIISVCYTLHIYIYIYSHLQGDGRPEKHGHLPFAGAHFGTLRPSPMLWETIQALGSCSGIPRALGGEHGLWLWLIQSNALIVRYHFWCQSRLTGRVQTMFCESSVCDSNQVLPTRSYLPIESKAVSSPLRTLIQKLCLDAKIKFHVQCFQDLTFFPGTVLSVTLSIKETVIPGITWKLLVLKFSRLGLLWFLWQLN